jgi:hypothetical protein
MRRSLQITRQIPRPSVIFFNIFFLKREVIGTIDSQVGGSLLVGIYSWSQNLKRTDHFRDLDID